MQRQISHAWLRRTELLLLVAGVLCAVYLAAVKVKAISAERASRSLFARPISSPAENQSSVDEQTPPTGQATIMGRLEIRDLKLSVPIFSNYESESLRKGVGYIPGTARPGGLGTLGLAGHRDTYFKPLRGIRANMDIRVADQTGVYHYEVDTTEIVTPDQVRVLDVQNRPELTLITCYPFNYIGAAPRRFIVHAHLLSAIPDEP
ncbi:class D sortase [Granulicella sibirica]|uniref:Sortase family protein n=1 Tax=Granulicella sibirica TaxID=2479048 RepID=A0A4Q0SZ13_9BACT|nr:class D sortase [Granulicella sibirica]RXH56087.1 hypothetical protein GRAN_2944 [Granulicella sibirica]